MRRLSPLFFPILTLLVAPSALAHQPADAHSARTDVRIDDQRGLRVRIWFEVPDAAATDVDSLRERLTGCLPLSLGGRALPGTWVRGDDPKDGLSNGSHTLVSLEFDPAQPVAAKRLVLTLTVECFSDKDLSLVGNVRAREPWKVVEEDLPVATVPVAAGHGDQGHGHPGHGHDDAPMTDGESRTLRVVFERSE